MTLNLDIQTCLIYAKHGLVMVDICAKTYDKWSKDVEVVNQKHFFFTLACDLDQTDLDHIHNTQSYGGHLCQVICTSSERCGSYAQEMIFAQQIFHFTLTCDLGHTYWSYMHNTLSTYCEHLCHVFLAWLESLHPSKQFFSHVGTGLPGLNQYYVCSRTEHSDSARRGSKQKPVYHLTHYAPQLKD